MSTTAAVATVALLTLALVGVFLGALRFVINGHRAELREMRAERERLLREFAVERSELILRVQRPDVVIAPRTESPVASGPRPEDEDEAELARVGQVFLGPEDADMAESS